MENQEKRKSFFAKRLTLFIIFGVIISCVILIGLKKINDNTPVDIDKAITQFVEEANKEIPKGSHIIVYKYKEYLKAPNVAIKNYIHLKIKQNFTKRSDIDVYTDSNQYLDMRTAESFIREFKIRSKGDSIGRDSIDINSRETFTIRARLEKFEGISPNKAVDKLFGDNYRFFISMEKNERNEEYARSILMKEYAIMDENLERLEFPIEKFVGDSLTEKEQEECIAELEQSLLSFLNYYDKREHSEQIEILFDDENCVSEICDEKGKCEPCTDGECPIDCKSKSKCFSYNHNNFDACGSTDIKNNLSMKGCPEGSVWKYNFCEPAGEPNYYSIPENSACKNITPKRVMEVNKEYCEYCNFEYEECNSNHNYKEYCNSAKEECNSRLRICNDVKDNTTPK